MKITPGKFNNENALHITINNNSAVFILVEDCMNDCGPEDIEYNGPCQPWQGWDVYTPNDHEYPGEFLGRYFGQNIEDISPRAINNIPE